MTALAPTLSTARLTLRMPVLGGSGHRAAFSASDRPVWEGGPKGRVQARRIWASDVGQRPLMGYGPFRPETGAAYVGEVGICQAADGPEPEAGWFVVPQAEGQGIAAEAARAVMGRARQAFCWNHPVGCIAPGDARSVAPGLRLDGRICDRPGIDPDAVVIEHDLRGPA